MVQIRHPHKKFGIKNFFSEEISGFFLKRSYELFGFFLLVIGLIFFLSLCTYQATDSCWNVISGQTVPHNFMGKMGAHLSDFSLQLMGFPSYLIAILLCVWGGRILISHNLPLWKLRLLALPLMIICVSLGMAGIDHRSLGGGALGSIVSAKLLSIVAPTKIPFWLVHLSFSLTGLGLFILITGLPKEVWISLGKLFCSMFVWFFKAIKNLAWPQRRTEQEQFIPEENSQKESLDLALKTPLKEATEQMAHTLVKKRPMSPTSFPSKSKEDHHDLPSLDLLQKSSSTGPSPLITQEMLSKQAEQLKNILKDFGVEGDVINSYPGPVVTLYEFKPAPGVKSSRVIGLADDIARSTSSLSTRISVMPGVNALGIEIPNPKKEKVYMRSLLETELFYNPSFKLPLALGKNISGDPVIGDLSRMPHLLIAGTTGSGKSVSINTMIMSLLYRLSPEECKFIMIDPKMLELSVYDGIPHLLTPVVTDPHKAVMALKWVVKEMERRYQIMSKLGVRSMDGYNERMDHAKKTGETLTHKVQTGVDSATGKPLTEECPLDMSLLPFIVVVVDEMADLMLVAGKDIESAVQRLAQMARAAGIHLIMATQRPSVDVITGTIKANFPTRISFHVTSKIDSRTILGEQGAEQLLGQGDMLYMKPGGRIVRVHGPFVEDQEVERVVQFLRSQGTPTYESSIQEDRFEAETLQDDDASQDDLYRQALEIILLERKASTSFIQRHLQIGYNRAARIIEQMEHNGVVTKPNHVGKRDILIEG